MATQTPRRPTQSDLYGFPTTPYNNNVYNVASQPSGSGSNRRQSVGTSVRGYSRMPITPATPEKTPRFPSNTHSSSQGYRHSQLGRKKVTFNQNELQDTTTYDPVATPANEMRRESFLSPTSLTNHSTRSENTTFSQGEVSKMLLQQARTDRALRAIQRRAALCCLVFSLVVGYFMDTSLWNVFSWGVCDVILVAMLTWSLVILQSDKSKSRLVDSDLINTQYGVPGSDGDVIGEQIRSANKNTARTPTSLQGPTQQETKYINKYVSGSAYSNANWEGPYDVQGIPTSPLPPPLPTTTPRRMSTGPNRRNSAMLLATPRTPATPRSPGRRNINGTSLRSPNTPLPRTPKPPTSSAPIPDCANMSMTSTGDLLRLTRHIEARQDVEVINPDVTMRDASFLPAARKDYDVGFTPLKYQIGYSKKPEVREQTLVEDTFMSTVGDSKNDGVLVNLEDSMDLWIRNFKKWFSSRVLRAVAQRIEIVDQGIPTFRVGEELTESVMANYEKVKQTIKMNPAGATAQDIMMKELWDERMVLERYIDIPKCKAKKYVLYRLRELANSDDLEMLRWNSGGFFIGKPWNNQYPTDSQIVYHMFCTFMDIVMPCLLPHRHNDYDGPCESPFTKYYTHTRDTLAMCHGQGLHREICLYFDETHPPRFSVLKQENTKVVEDRSVSCQPGRENLFQALSLFIYRAKADMHGHL
eukprot:Ihof_evm1s567 gene=Ihof_evmTU1s567